MTDKHEPTSTLPEPEATTADAQEPQSRREFLLGLGKWSRVVIAGAVFGGAALTHTAAQAGWINRRGGVVRGGSWVNRRGGVGGGSWINRR